MAVCRRQRQLGHREALRCNILFSPCQCRQSAEQAQSTLPLGAVQYAHRYGNLTARKIGLCRPMVCGAKRTSHIHRRPHHGPLRRHPRRAGALCIHCRHKVLLAQSVRMLFCACAPGVGDYAALHCVFETIDSSMAALGGGSVHNGATRADCASTSMFE